jgi:hypothetical protein
MEIQDAQNFIADFLKREKESGKDVAKVYGNEYVDAVKQAKRIKPHVDPDHKPQELFVNRSPNATAEQMKYVLDNYKCTTLPVWVDFLSVIGRSFIDTNWQIIWKDGSDGLKDYTEKDFPVWGNLEYFIKSVLPTIKLSDPNGMIAVRPYRFNVVALESGERVIEDTKEFEPALYFHPSEKILIRRDDLVLVIGDDKSRVIVGDIEKLEGRVLYLYTPTHIYKFEQYGKAPDNTYQMAYSYEHGDGVMPITTLKGIPYIRTNGSVFWVSPFRYAVDLLDLALTNKNILQVSIAGVVFPFRIMMADPCDFENDLGRCSMGKWVTKLDGFAAGNCHQCGGSGNKVPYSPTGVFLYSKPERTLEGVGGYSGKPVEFVEAPVNGLTFIREEIELDTQKARQILHLHTSNTNVKGSEDMTATGIAIDRDAQFAFVRGISEQIFDLWDWTYKRVAFQRYGNYEQVPSLVRPQSFEFRTESDIWEQIKLARESQAPVIIIHGLFYSLLNTIHASDPIALKVFDTVTNADQLFAMSDAQLAMSRATIEPWRVTLHNTGLQLVNELIRKDPTFLDKDLTDRIAALVDIAKMTTFVPQSNSAINDIIAIGG